jgi:MYXO-CTERM domain-containing protein
MIRVVDGRVGVVVATMLGTWLWCDRAQACEFGEPIPVIEFPAEEATGVPTNPRLWLADHNELQGETLILRTPDGTEIPLVTTKVRGFAWMFLVMTPSEELLPNTRYEVSSCSLGFCGRALRTFTTGDGPDLDPPPLPEEIGRESGIERVVLCGANHGWVDVTVDFDGVLVIDLDIPEFDEQTVTGRPDWLATDADEPIVFGDLGLGLRSPIHGRMGVFDQAGNFSGWVELDPIEVPGCGCTSDPEGAPPRWSWLVLSLIAIARPRRRTPARVIS